MRPIVQTQGARPSLASAGRSLSGRLAAARGDCGTHARGVLRQRPQELSQVGEISVAQIPAWHIQAERSSIRVSALDDG